MRCFRGLHRSFSHSPCSSLALSGPFRSHYSTAAPGKEKRVVPEAIQNNEALYKAPSASSVPNTRPIVNHEEFDYVIVGAGSAGCVLANRLTADGKHSALILEYGGSDRHIYIQMPSALNIPMNMERFNWFYETEPEPHLGGRRFHCPRGKALGGSSSINGLVYIRGNPHDFDLWEEQGAKGWSYNDCLPYFRRAETRKEGGNEYRGHDGPLHTCYGTLTNPLNHAWIKAGQQAGYPLTEDVNGFQQEGFGRMDMTVHKGKRWSSADAYLKPAMVRPNLTVKTSTLASSVMMEGKRAVGVKYMKGSVEYQARARKEVILSGGAINSPQLLKLSGIGAPEELRHHNIEVKHALPGVGENLQDHMEFYFQMACTQPITLYSAQSPLQKGLIGMRWLLKGDGLGATNHFESCGFLRSKAGIKFPDIQYHFLPLAVTYDGKSLAQEHGFQAHVGSLRTKSRGWVRLRSPNPADKARILFNYMSHEDDWEEARACVRLTREIFQQDAFAPFRGREIQPGEGVVTDEQIHEFVMKKMESALHPCGTCKMGSATDPSAVVDPELRVIGLEGLRVVDASIMPNVTSGNLNAPTIMLAEKAADHILGKPLLSPEKAPVYISPNWKTHQR